MEPVDYLKILKNHWKVVLALIIVAVVAIYFTSPKTPSKAYTADHKLLLEQGVGGTSSMANVGTVAELAVNPEVVRRAADALQWEGEPEDLAGKVEAVGDPDLLIITITGHGGTPDEAIAIANAVGEEVKKYVDERETQRLQTAAAETQAQRDDLSNQLAQINGQLAADPNNQQLIAEQARITNQLGSMFSVEDRASYTTVLQAAFASEDAAFVAGFGREQRALIAAVVAALAGFGVAIMLDRSDSRLRTKDQVERRFGLPVLAEVPLLALRDRSRAAVVAFEREPRVAEAYRGLRTALLLFRRRGEAGQASNGNGHGAQPLVPGSATSSSSMRQLVVVTSPEAGDGKSTTVANLAMAYAEAGQSVLLVSWDLWRPLSPRVFDAEEGPGVADYLNGNTASLVRYVQDTSIPGVRIVTAGLGGHHTYTQIENARRLLEEARTLANIVIVDTAPILSASVTRELVTLADAVIVVCRSGRTTGPVADRCAELLERLGAPALGLVLVGVPTGPFADYYGAPPEGRPVERSGFRRRSEEAVPRHKAPTGVPMRPTSAQYRATTPRGPEGREPR